MKKCVEFVMGLCLLAVVFCHAGPAALWKRGGEEAPGAAAKASPVFTAVLDAGHGGRDPGKVGAGGVYEKDVNLAVALKLKPFLEEKGIRVILTREGDEGLYRETDSNKKKADLKERCRIIEESGADFVVSIHQNSYGSEEVHGSQVFYYKGSAKGKDLAVRIQERLNAVSGTEKEAVPNGSYYMLLNVSCPIVIAECGFLSNPGEAALLASGDYQEQMARAMAEGIFEWLGLLDTQA